MVNILISTINGGIESVKNILLEPREDVEYIVSHQYTSERFKKIPAALLREDVIISQIPGKGLSKSRNHAISLATGDIGIIADDDVTYCDSYIDIVKDTFLSNPSLDVALFKIKTGNGEPEYKNYPKVSLEYTKNLFFISSIEIAFNIKKIKEAGLQFDERFGAGQELIIGYEEMIFVEDCLKAGLSVVFIPEFIVEHPYMSTSKTIPRFDKRKNWVAGAYDCRSNGSIALLKAFGGTFRILPELLEYDVNPLVYLYHRLSAAIYILRTNNRDHKSGHNIFNGNSKSKVQISKPTKKEEYYRVIRDRISFKFSALTGRSSIG